MAVNDVTTTGQDELDKKQMPTGPVEGGGGSPATLQQDDIKDQPMQGDDSLSPDQIRTIDYIKSHCVDCLTIGEEYRWKFKFDWDAIEGQVREINPPEWDHKEPWQTKVFVGLQAKTSESAYSNMSSMVFPTDRFYTVQGVQERDRDVEQGMENLFQVLMDRGGFYYQKDLMLEEAIDIGTSFLKMMARPDKSGIDFVWRSAYDCFIDPQARHDWDQMHFWIDQYPKDLSYLIDELQKDNSKYNKDLLRFGLTAYVEQALKYAESTANTQRQTDLALIRNIDGTGYMRIPKNFKTIILNEYWGLVPMPNDFNDPTKGYTLKPMVVTMLNKDFILRYDDNPYGFIPAIPAKIKPRKYDGYGKGYLLNGRGTQELMNSMINLAFDSQKMSSMDIIIADESKIADQNSIQYKPMAVWKVKGDPRAAVMMTRQANGMSAMKDVLQGINFLDQVHQDVTGVTRHAEGSSSDAKGEGDQTLGEYQLKLQAVDKRFLSVARRFEQDFTERLLRNMYAIVTNPKLFNQEACDNILGVKMNPIQNPLTGETIQVPSPKLDLGMLQKAGPMAWNFKGYGVTQFSERQEIMQKLQQALQACLNAPPLLQLTNVDVLWRRLFQVSQIPDWEQIVKSPEQIQQLQQFLQAQQQMVPAGGGLPLNKIPPPHGVPTRPANQPQQRMGPPRPPMGHPQGMPPMPQGLPAPVG